MKKIGFVLLGISAAVYITFWLGMMLFGMFTFFPFGLLGLIPLTGIGLLFLKVIMDRLDSEEDDYYSKNVDK